IQAVDRAGGEGSRLRPLTINRPKPMVSIVNKPCLGHIFDLLKRHSIEDAFVTLQYLASVIQDFYGDGGGVGMRLRYSVEESPLGTGGSVRPNVRTRLATLRLLFTPPGDVVPLFTLSRAPL